MEEPKKKREKKKGRSQLVPVTKLERDAASTYCFLRMRAIAYTRSRFRRRARMAALLNTRARSLRGRQHPRNDFHRANEQRAMPARSGSATGAKLARARQSAINETLGHSNIACTAAGRRYMVLIKETFPQPSLTILQSGRCSHRKYIRCGPRTKW